MGTRIARHILALVAAASVAVLAGCAQSGDLEGGGPAASAPTPATLAEADPTPVPSPTADPRVTEIQITAERIELYNDESALVRSFDYFQPTEEVVAGLTEVFGTAPTAENYSGAHAAGVRHAWDGFHLMEPNHDEPPYWPNHWVLVTAPATHGVSVHTLDGIAVGDSAPELEAAYPDTSNRVKVYDKPERLDVRVGIVALPDPAGEPEAEKEFSVYVSADDPAATVTDFRAPAPNFGP